MFQTLFFQPVPCFQKPYKGSAIHTPDLAVSSILLYCRVYCFLFFHFFHQSSVHRTSLHWGEKYCYNAHIYKSTYIGLFRIRTARKQKQRKVLKAHVCYSTYPNPPTCRMHPTLMTIHSGSKTRFPASTTRRFSPQAVRSIERHDDRHWHRGSSLHDGRHYWHGMMVVTAWHRVSSLSCMAWWSSLHGMMNRHQLPAASMA